MLDIENTALVVIDVQGKLTSLVYDHEKVLKNIEYFIEAAKTFQLPVLWSEQAPDKIGTTIDLLKKLLLPITKPIAKRTFSCYGAPEFVEALKKLGRQQIIITGIETHVCIYQTACDLKRHGYEVFLVADAVSSRYQLDRDMAITRLRDEGVVITTAEMAICELLKTADNPHFKQVVSYLKR